MDVIPAAAAQGALLFQRLRPGVSVLTEEADVVLSGSRPPALRMVTRSLQTLPWIWKLRNAGPHPRQPRPQLGICSLGTFDAPGPGAQL